MTTLKPRDLIEATRWQMSDNGAGGENDNRWIRPIDFESYDPNEPIPCLIGDPHGEILIAAGEMVALVSEIGVGKTIMTASLAVSLAFGRELLGFKIAHRHKVLAILADGDSERSVKARACRFAAGLGISPAELRACGRVQIVVPDGYNLDDDAAFAETRAVLSEYDPDVLMTETLATLAGPERAMNEAGPAADFVKRRLRPLQTRPDGSRRTVIVGGHMIKPRGGRATSRNVHRIAGSFYVAGGFDAAVELSATRQPRQFRLMVSKPSREGCTFKPRIVDIEGEPPDPLLLVHRKPVEVDAAPVTGRPPEKRKATMAFLANLKAKNPGMDKTWAAKECVKALVCSRALAYEVWNAVYE